VPNQPSDLESFLAAIDGKDFLVLDTETTGLGPDAEICEIAIVTADGETLYDSYVKPSIRVSPDAARIHGISDEIVAGASSWALQQHDIERIIDGNIIVSYNATFDRKLMHQSDRAWGMGEKPYGENSFWYCAMTAFAERYGNWNDYRANYQWVKLIDAVRFYDIKPRGEFHGALADALMTLDVVRALEKDVADLLKAVPPDPVTEGWSNVRGAASPRKRGQLDGH
jgi:DNA polymerase III subunit epsilon